MKIVVPRGRAIVHQQQAQALIIRKVVMPNSSTGGPTPSTYRSYMVRFWQSNEQGGWRASAQCVQTGNTVLFGNVESLLAFLHAEINASASEDHMGITIGSSISS